MNKIEIIGLIASILIVVSMVFKTTSFKGTILMRIINAIGSIFFTVYGFSIKAYSTGICNSILFLVNIFYLIKEIKDHNCINSCKKNNQNI